MINKIKAGKDGNATERHKGHCCLATKRYPPVHERLVRSNFFTIVETFTQFTCVHQRVIA